MFNDTLKLLNEKSLRYENTYMYIPEPDYSYINDLAYLKINKFIYDIVDKQLILISNGDVHSNQAYNFNFTPIIKSLAEANENSIFIATSTFDRGSLNNIYFTESLFLEIEYGSDLPEISYLSSYMDIIIGRSSGPFTFTQTKFNYKDENKKIVSFTYEKDCAHMIDNTVSKAKLYWSNLTNTSDITKFLGGILNE